MEDHPQPSSTRPTGGRRRLTKVLDLLALSFVGLVVVAGLALIALRCYFNDDRLRRMAVAALHERLVAEVSLEELELSLFTGVELRGFRIGPLPAFSEETVAFSRMALRWSALDLLRLRLTIDDLALEGLRAALEETPEQGRNIEALQRALLGPPSDEPPSDEPPSDEPKPETAEPAPATKPLEQPSLPVRVEVRRMAMLVERIRVLRPDLQLEVGELGLLGRFVGQGQAMDLALWVGLGAPPPARESTHLRVRGVAMPPVDVNQRLDLRLTSGGLGSIELALDWDAAAEVGGDRPLPPVRLRGGLTVVADLLQQTVRLTRCQWSVNERTQLSLAVAAEQVLTAPQARLKELRLRSDLSELAPFAAVFVPGLELAGEVRLDAEPFLLPLNPGAVAEAEAKILVAVANLNTRLNDLRVEGLNLELTLAAAAGDGKATLRAQLDRAAAAGQQAQQLRLELDAATPLSPWLGGPASGVVTLATRLSLAHAGSSAARASGVQLELSAATPVALVQSGTSSEPLVATVRLGVRQATAANAEVNRIEVGVDASVWDLRGEQVEVRLRTDLRQVAVALEPDLVQLEKIGLRLNLARRGADVDLSELSLAVGELFSFAASGRVADFQGPAPVFDGFDVRIGPLDLQRLLTLAPASKRPSLTLSGQLGLQARLHGQVPHAALLARMQPPVIAEADRLDLAVVMQTYAAYAQKWQTLFAEGLPFVANCDLTLADVHFADPTNEVRGLNLDLGFGLEKHGPGTTMTLVIDEVAKPVVAQGVRFDLRLGFTDGNVELALGGGAETVAQAGLARPLSQIGLEARFRYRLGGDLAVDTLALKLAEPAVLLSASGVVSKPLQLALARGWEKPGLPGLAAALRWQASFDAGSELRSLNAEGPRLAGGVGLAGSILLEDGLLRVEGELGFTHLHVEQGDTVLTDLSGRLPLELHLSFDPRDEYTVLRRGVPLGSGVIALRTAAEDIRKRAARPAYYERLRPYQRRAGLTARRLRAGEHEVRDFALDGRVTQGMLLIDWLSLHLLGGDIQGHLGVQVGRDASLRTDLAVKFANLDASYFGALDLKPGPQSELSADLQLGFLAAPRGRDLTLNMNITKIGSQTLDRFLQLLDPKREKDAIQSARGNLWLVKIDEVKTWIRYENLNLDLAVTTFLRVPWTSIGYPNLDRELLRGFSLSDYLDAYLQPQIDGVLAPSLGWKDAG